MTTTSGDSRRIGQLRNDVDDIYDILGSINATLDVHTTTLGQHSETLDQHSVVLNEHTVKLDRVIELLETR